MLYTLVVAKYAQPTNCSLFISRLHMQKTLPPSSERLQIIIETALEYCRSQGFSEKGNLDSIRALEALEDKPPSDVLKIETNMGNMEMTTDIQSAANAILSSRRSSSSLEWK